MIEERKHIENYVPKISKLLVVVILGLILSFAGILLKFIVPYFMGTAEYGVFSLKSQMYLYVYTILLGIFNLFIAIWLCVKASKKEQAPFVWFLFGLFFGIIAIILFYLIILIEEVKTLNANFKRQNL